MGFTSTRLMGYHCDTFYEVMRAFQIGGIATLAEQKRGPRNPHPNRVATDIETDPRLLVAVPDAGTAARGESAAPRQREGQQRAEGRRQSLHAGHRRRLVLLRLREGYTSKMPITACDLMHDRVLPFYENLGLTVGAVLTDNGRDFRGKPESHP
jgi:hypothetical protein